MGDNGLSCRHLMIPNEFRLFPYRLDHHNPDGRQEHDRAADGCDPEIRVSQMPQTDGFPDCQGDENIEYRSGSDQALLPLAS